MSSDSESSNFPELSNNSDEEDFLEEEEKDVEDIFSQVTPYEDESLADIVFNTGSDGNWCILIPGV